MDRGTKDLKISEIFSDLPRLKVFDEILKTYEENRLFSPQHRVVDRNTYLGIEVEVENVQRWDVRQSPYWTMIEDGSLRNSGREFITPPIRAWRVEHAITKLFQTLNPDIDFSERTSIHVHMNIRTLTVEQLEALIITYMVFEKVLFSYVGDNRYDNIFCVPLCETDLGISLKKLILSDSPHITWEKYTALNLCPINSKGTIEFRHLGGTRDIDKLMGWINLILCLKTFALRNDVDYIWHRIGTLNTTSEYRMFGEEVFGERIHSLFTQQYNQEVASCVTYVKDKCLHNSFVGEIKNQLTETSNYPQQTIPTNYLQGFQQGWTDSVAEVEEAPRQWPFINSQQEFNRASFQEAINRLQDNPTIGSITTQYIPTTTPVFTRGTSTLDDWIDTPIRTIDAVRPRTSQLLNDLIRRSNP